MYPQAMTRRWFPRARMFSDSWNPVGSAEDFLCSNPAKGVGELVRGFPLGWFRS
jgi:hypothetical protein